MAPPEVMATGSSAVAGSCWERLSPVLRGYGGHSSGVTGETLLYLFGRASDALAAALAGMAALRLPPRPASRVRIALHTGEVEPEELVPHSRALARTTRL